MGRRDIYEIRITPYARRSLQKLRKNRVLVERILDAIGSLAENPRPHGYKKLASGRYDNLYRIRVGDWRILYAIEEDTVIVVVLDVVRRDQAYKWV
jgi:mRNA interferase RelE/StbE